MRPDSVQTGPPATPARRRRRWLVASLLAALAVPAAAPAGEGEDGRSLRLVLRAARLPGVPVLVRVEVLAPDGSVDRGVTGAEAFLTAAAPGVELRPARVPLRSGLGSALVAVDGPGDVDITARALGLEATRPLGDLSLRGAPERMVSGTLPSGDVEWSGIVHVTGDVVVPEDGTLTVHPGTLVLLAGVPSGEDGADIEVRGRLEALGTEERPVTFTAEDPARPWGELRHLGSRPSEYRWAVITRAGHSPGGGHTGTGPALRPQGTELRLESTSVTDLEGKTMQADDSVLELEHCLLARSVMGPEIDDSGLLLRSSWCLEMFGEDDNDAIYLHSQRSGQTMLVEGCVFSAGDDDGIDTLSASVDVRDCIVRDMADKGISVFHGDVRVQGSVLAGNDIGISAKSADGQSADVDLRRTTIARNRIAVQARDKNDEPEAVIRYTIASSILEPGGVPDGVAVQTDYDPADIRIRWSDVRGGWPGEGNIDADPLFADAESGDLRLREGSPCIDAGDPGAAPDPDGTRADQGARPRLREPSAAPPFLRGDTQGDGLRDVSDAVSVLLHLFAGGPLACSSAADTDDDGRLAVTDAVALLGWLFRGGPPPAPPAAACGDDPTPDALGCEATLCP